MVRFGYWISHLLKKYILYILVEDDYMNPGKPL